MHPTTPEIAKAIETARTLLEREISERARLGADGRAAALWAGVTRDGRIRVGTPLFHPGEGFYVDCNGHWMQA